MRASLVIALLIALAPRPAHAQAQPQQPPPPPPVRETTAEFAFVGTTGNSSTGSIGVGGELIYRRPEPWTFSTKATYVRNESESVLKAESFDLALKAARALGPRLSAFSRYGFLHDRFAGIDARNTVEGGLSYLVVDAAPHKLTADAALGYAHESRLVGPNLSTAVLPVGALYTLTLSETAQVSDDARLVLSLSDSSDWRVANIASVTAKLTTLLSLKLSNTIRFVNEPVFGFKKTDTITAVALVAKF